jgi:RNA polymerase sigma-70 factor (ECF subfamily)
MTDLGRTRTSIIKRAQQGDATEFAQLYAPLAYSIARKNGLDEADAEDVSQQTMLELLRMLPTFCYDRSHGSFKGLVKKIVLNRTTDVLRRRRRMRGDSILEAAADTRDEFDAMFEREWRKTHLLLALDRVRKEVKPRTYQSFQLVVLGERPVAEVARTLGLTRNQVSQNKRRVLLRLQAHLKELQGETR